MEPFDGIQVGKVFNEKVQFSAYSSESIQRIIKYQLSKGTLNTLFLVECVLSHFFIEITLWTYNERLTKCTAIYYNIAIDLSEKWSEQNLCCRKRKLSDNL